jgi:ATPase subunit of ABC transporter with duplicated ATPase domains
LTPQFEGKMAEFIYQMIKARKAHGDKLILDDVTLSFIPGAKIGVVGPNGSGKSSVLKIMAGLDTPSNGEARLSDGYTVGILMQEPKLDESKTVLGNVEEAVKEVKAKLDRFNEISAELANPDADYDRLLEEMGTLQEAIDHLDAWDLDSQLEQAMDALRCPPSDTPVAHLSGGEKRRVALCKLLLEKPDLLLLDEPTNHLDAESVLWLEQHLAKYPGAVLADATLITIIIVLAALTLFVATLIIRHSSLCLSLPAVMVVLSSMLSCQALPTFDAPVTI